MTEPAQQAGQAPALRRCGWAMSEQMRRYHDEEWGVPLYDDRALFEFLVLEGAQAGLSWSTILNKRAHYREAFAGFDIATVAAYGDAHVEQLLGDPGIVRNRQKIAAAIQNARAALAVQREFGGFAGYLWRFVGGQPHVNAWTALGEIPASSPESDAMSKELKRRGFAFVGTTICYAFMQATGMVNDHVVDCFRYAQLTVGDSPPRP